MEAVTEESKITQTDQLIGQLKEEFSFLLKKVNRLENEKVNKDDLYSETLYQHSVIDDLRSQYKKQRLEYQDNLKIASKLITEIQTPILKVSQNLKEVSIKSSEKTTKESIDNCILMLETLEKQCADVGSYFNFLLEKPNLKIQNCKIKDLFSFTKNAKNPKFVVDFEIEQEQKIYIQKNLLEKVLSKLFLFFQSIIVDFSQISILVQSVDSQFSINDKLSLNIKILFQTKQSIFQTKPWMDVFKFSGDFGDKMQLDWRKIKKDLGECSGNLFVTEKTENLNEISILVPFEIYK